MLVKIINDKGRVVMQTSFVECLPNKTHIDSMVQNGYKFNVDGKNVTKKTFIEVFKDREIDKWKQ